VLFIAVFLCVGSLVRVAHFDNRNVAAFAFLCTKFVVCSALLSNFYKLWGIFLIAPFYYCDLGGMWNKAAMCSPVMPFTFTLFFLLFFLTFLPSNSLHLKSVGGIKYRAKHACVVEKKWKTSSLLRTTFQGFLI
jgi:hypothetical protein